MHSFSPVSAIWPFFVWLVIHLFDCGPAVVCHVVKWVCAPMCVLQQVERNPGILENFTELMNTTMAPNVSLQVSPCPTRHKLAACFKHTGHLHQSSLPNMKTQQVLRLYNKLYIQEQPCFNSCLAHLWGITIGLCLVLSQSVDLLNWGTFVMSRPTILGLPQDT